MHRAYRPIPLSPSFHTLQAMLHAGLSTITDLSRQVARLNTRNKKLSSKAARKRAEAEARGQPVCRCAPC